MPKADGGTPPWLDGALYPDEPLPPTPLSSADRCDFLARLCSAWDFGVLPSTDTVEEVKRSHWRDTVETCRLLTSPAYHLLRRWHGLETLPYLGQQLAYIRDDPELEHV
ncbi:MAG: hypothetical protein ACYC5O_12720 [Anaerolineae bacterium]